METLWICRKICRVPGQGFKKFFKNPPKHSKKAARLKKISRAKHQAKSNTFEAVVIIALVLAIFFLAPLAF